MRLTKLASLAFLALSAAPPAAIAAPAPLPKNTAAATEVASYLLAETPVELQEGKDDPATNRLLSISLKALWRAANAAQSRPGQNRADNAVDMNWITNGQDFELESRTLVSPNPYTVVAYLKGKAGETPIVRYVFAREGGAWKLADVHYGGGSNPIALSTILQDQIDKAEPRVAIPGGFGTFNAAKLHGPASVAVREFLAETFVHCDFKTVGRCPMRSVADHIDLHYVDTHDGRAQVAIALINYTTDMSGSDMNMVAVWTKSHGAYELQASGWVEYLTDAKASAMDDGRILLSGLTTGPNDSRCCPTDPTFFKVGFAGGMLDVDVHRRIPRPEDGKEYVPRLPFTPLQRQAVLAAAAPETNTETEAHRVAVRALGGSPSVVVTDPSKTAQPNAGQVRTDHVAIDLRRYILGSEPGELKDHNGSDVLVFEKAGLIVYVKPKTSIAAMVKPGDVLFRGRIAASGIEGQAYAFKGGCSPIAYRVRGPRFRPDGKSDFSIELKGEAPVRSGPGCAPSRYSASVPNATLHFGFASVD